MLAAMSAVIAGASAAHPPAPTPAPAPAPQADREDKPTPPPALILENGRQNATWRKDQPIDYSHTAIELDIPDFSQPLLTGVVTHVGRVKGLAVSEIVLDCDGPEVIAASVNGGAARFAQADKQLVISIGGELERGAPVAVVVKYNLDFSGSKGDGLTFSPPVEDPQNATDRRPVVHAQGQAEVNSLWVPMFDSPQERLTSEVVVTVDADVDVLSNGVLLSTTPANAGSAGQPRQRWHWSLDREHAPYLITLAIGDFDVVDVNDRSDSLRPGLPMPVYVPVGRADDARGVFANTPAMVACFEELFDEPFPWPQYAQAVVRGFRWGGMENTGATLLTAGTIDRGPYAADGLIAHELAHQWFGDLLTCRHWDHVWLNEGWATYAEALWYEWAQRAGVKTSGTYEAEIRGLLRSHIRASREMVWDESTPEPAMVEARYRHPDDKFFGRDNAYTKGALLLHAIRQRMGDDSFFAAVRAYVDRFKGKPVETDDFRFVLEEFHGRDLERMIDQWALRPGMAFVSVEGSWDQSASALRVRLTQTQPIGPRWPAYSLRVPLVLTDASGSTSTVVATTSTRESVQSFAMGAPPVRIDVDPMISQIASFQPRAFDPSTGAAFPDVIEAEPPKEEPAPAPADTTPAAAASPAQPDATAQPAVNIDD
jgi:aminopeptidase N